MLFLSAIVIRKCFFFSHLNRVVKPLSAVPIPFEILIEYCFIKTKFKASLKKYIVTEYYVTYFSKPSIDKFK